MGSSNRHWDWCQTIVAPATAPGSGMRAILRISGSEAHRLVAECLAAPPVLPWAKKQVFRADWRVDAWQRQVAVEVYSWPDGRSYTGQPIAEVHLPACPPLEAALATQLIGAGARPALPGEFSLRAFRAGRIDLLQAEAIVGLVEARNTAQLQWAIDQHAGGLSRPLVALRHALLDLLADLEAGLDFADEDVRFVTDAETIDRLTTARTELRHLHEKLGGRALDQPAPRIVLVGAPNAGKSSLFNLLAGAQHALVSREAGTTRDYLTVRIRIGEQAVELIDTAGMDPPTETISAQAARGRGALIENCHLLLHCVPAGAPWPAARAPLTNGNHTGAESAAGGGSDDLEPAPRVLRVRTKCDLMAARDAAADCHVTVMAADGAAELRAALARLLEDLDWAGAGAAGPAAVRLRSGVERALTDLDDSLRLAAAATGHEILAVTLRDAIDALGELVGAVYTDDLLDRVFSRFCIGK